MKYNEWIENKQGLFQELNSIHNYLFISDFGAENLDMLYTMMYGEKPIPKALQNRSVNDVARLIHRTFGDNWQKQHSLLQDELILGVDSKEVVDETSKDSTKTNETGTKTNKVSAYNSDTMVNNDSSEDTSDNTQEKDVDRNTTKTNSSLQAIERQMQLLNRNFLIDTVCKDVSKLVSLSIY